MKNYRIFVEKHPQFGVEAESLRRELNSFLSLEIESLRLINTYDLFGFSEELFQKSLYSVFGERVTDRVEQSADYAGHPYIAVEYLPGQFDQRAASAEDCVRLIDPEAKVRIRSGKLLIFDDSIGNEDLERIKHYYINAVESRQKDLDTLELNQDTEVKPVPVMEGFVDMEPSQYQSFCQSYGLAMNGDDLGEVVKYFRSEGRNPNQTELRILDTYWSDHCRHTTFTTILNQITVRDSFISDQLKESLDLYHKMRSELGRQHKPLCMMDMATIGARYLRAHGYLDDMEQSEENNACSIFVDVDNGGVQERWLLQFKNETHNHPTEIEPFGGASTCLGGAIRDPLSGRSYVYQAMRVTGAGDIYQPLEQTLKGKLPQRVISTKAAAGYSSYGNQIGLATTHVCEIYHPDYVAKRLEVGAVVGAVKASNVRRESPAKGDVVLLLGGHTGRDGIGGATGSSKKHNVASLETCSSEVQKGNAPEERKLSRLFRRAEVTSLIKKSNDFGAGGVSVAIGELADGLDIYLDRVPTKYSGLNSTELAISESQERMAVVVERKDMELFCRYARQENVEVTHVADVTDTQRMRMFLGEETVVDLKREFIDSAGAPHYTSVEIAAVEEINPFHRNPAGDTIEQKCASNLSDANVTSQKGLIEMFDSSIGRSTVLMPFGGITQRSQTQVSVQKLPTEGATDTASIMAFGYNPYLTSWSPYHGAAYAVVDAVTKVVAAGARYDKMRFTYQEYFQRMDTPLSWGKPTAALLGALRMQYELKLPSIGGKDSMSGTFQDINVPPMLMAFGITTVDVHNVISTDFKAAGNYLYLVEHHPLKDYMPDTEELKGNFDYLSNHIEAGDILSAYAVGFGGVSEAVAKMSFGNRIGVEIEFDADQLFDWKYGSVVVESRTQLDYVNARLLGRTCAECSITINSQCMPIEQLCQLNAKPFTDIYPDHSSPAGEIMKYVPERRIIEYNGPSVVKPVAYLPVFPGTNCDYDTAKAFRKAGATVTSSVFCNLEADDIIRSIEQMKEHIDNCQILVLSGGFSAGDEPDGSGKFIANVLNNAIITQSVHNLLERGGLILGICNGFQALVKSGLLPYGRLGTVTTESPTLFRNNINRHISQMATTRVASVNSPWLSSFGYGELHTVAMSHGEGKFVVSPEMAHELFVKGQVAFQYVDTEGKVTCTSPFNPNGSSYAIEGIISPDGKILGKMGHSERYEEGLMKNICGNKQQDIFANAVNYFRRQQ